MADTAPRFPSPSLEDVAICFRKLEWAFDKDERRNTIRSQFKGENRVYQLLCRLIPEKNILWFSVPFITRLQPETRLQTVEHVLRENNLFLLGAFQINEHDEVSFEVSLPVDGRLHFEQFDHVFTALVHTVDREYPNLMRVVWNTAEDDDDDAEDDLDAQEFLGEEMEEGDLGESLP